MRGRERLEEENERKEATLSKMWEKISVMLEKEYIIMSRRVQLADIIAILLLGVIDSCIMLQAYLALLHMPPVVKIPGFI